MRLKKSAIYINTAFCVGFKSGKKWTQIYLPMLIIDRKLFKTDNKIPKTASEENKLFDSNLRAKWTNCQFFVEKVSKKYSMFHLPKEH